MTAAPSPTPTKTNVIATHAVAGLGATLLILVGWGLAGACFFGTICAVLSVLPK